MQRAVLAVIYSLVITLTMFLVIYLGIESFDIRDGDYIEIEGEFFDLSPQLLAPIKWEQLWQRYPERFVIGCLGCSALVALAWGATRGVPRFSRPIAAFVLAAAGGFAVYTAALYFYGYTDWNASMLSALSIAPALGAYCLGTFLYSRSWSARLGDAFLIILSGVFAISWTQLLRTVFS